MNQRKKKAILKINMAQSLDGHTISPDGKWALGTAEDKRRMDKLRLWADCLIASRRSIENDNPNLIARFKPSGKHPRPVIILQNSLKKISPDRRIFNHPHPYGEFWVYGRENLGLENIIEGFENLEGKLKKRIEQWKVFSFLKIKDIYSSLVKRDYKNILLEGGPTLNGIFLKEDLIDEVYFTLVPFIWAGNSSDRIITTSEFIEPKKFKLINVERRKNEVFFRYKKNSSL